MRARLQRLVIQVLTHWRHVHVKVLTSHLDWTRQTILRDSNHPIGRTQNPLGPNKRRPETRFAFAVRAMAKRTVVFETPPSQG